MDENHRVLSEYGEPFPEGIKFSKFLMGIQFPIMSNAKCTTVANHTTVAIFILDTDYLARFI